MIIFFENYSIIQSLFLFKYIRQARIIYFNKRASPTINHNSIIEKFVKRLIYLINKDVDIKFFSPVKINEYSWEMNKKAVDIIEKYNSDIKNSAIYRMTLHILKDDNILKFYKMRLVDFISARLLFIRMVKDLIQDGKDKIYIVFCDNSHANTQKELLGNEALNLYIPPASVIGRAVGEFFYKTYLLLIFLLMPLLFIIINIKRITLRGIKKGDYDIAMPIIWGFHNKDVIVDGVKRQNENDDSYLYSEEIKAGSIIHIFNYWRQDVSIEDGYKKIMSYRGIPFINTLDYKMNLKLILKYLKIQFEILKLFFVNFFYWHLKFEYTDSGIGIVHHMLRKYLELENVSYKVELMRHDYSPSHIIETIICNKNNRKTIGIQHGSNAGPYVLNSLCYAHFDKYCIFSQRHLELHEPFWNRLNLQKTGSYRIDQVVEIANNPQLLESIKGRISDRYGERNYIALILFPSPLEYNLHIRWDTMYEALSELRDIDIDCHIFLRFRSADHLEKESLKRFKGLLENDGRFIIDLTNFSSFELMAVSDLVIGSSHSSAVIEAVSIGKKTFAFDYMGTTKYSFNKYGKDLVLNRKEEVLALFKNLENNFSGYDCNWDLLKEEYNFYYDGKCLRRLQEVVIEAVKEIGALNN